MAWEWTQTPQDSAFHPRLEPVSAWLFRRNSPYLRTGGSDTAMLYSMPLNPEGFQPDVRDSWRALSVENPATGDNPAAEAFGMQALEALLAPLGSFDDPRVFVLPLAEGGLMTPEELRRRARLGTPRRPTPAHPLPTPTAIVGIIDHGINIFHNRFRHHAAGTRVAYAWMQGNSRQEDRLPFGREWVQADIETALAEAGSDEETLVRQIGGNFSQAGFHPMGFAATHGTHVLDLAAGFDPQDAEGAAYPIIAVTLPPEVTRETSGSMLALPFALGLEYIADRARHVMFDSGSVVPVVVNFSFGLTGGPRNGMHRLEQTIQRIADHHKAEVEEHFGVNDASFTVVMAAGNNNLSRGHARNTSGTARLEVGWQLQPADPTPNFLEIRLAPEQETPLAGLEVTISLRPPGADAEIVTTVNPAQGRVLQNTRLLTRDGSVIGRLSVWRHDDGVAQLTLALDGTDPLDDARAVSPAGTWQIAVQHTSPTPHRIDMWVLRDDVPGGFRDMGRQSYFTDADHTVRDARGRLITQDAPDDTSVIKRAGSLNALAADTNQQTRQNVGAVTGPDMPEFPQPVAAAYSATPLDNSGEHIDISAISDRSLIRQGVRAAGTRSGSRALIGGTSVAAPQLVRHLATGAGTLSATQNPETDVRLGTFILTGLTAE